MSENKAGNKDRVCVGGISLRGSPMSKHVKKVCELVVGNGEVFHTEGPASIKDSLGLFRGLFSLKNSKEATVLRAELVREQEM